jgi:hypothetical protein
VTGEFVVTGRNGYGELSATPSVSLRGPPGAGPGASSQPNIVGLEQPLCLQSVEVKLRLMTGDANLVCRLVTSHGLILRTDVLIQLAAYGVGQDADTLDVPVEALHATAFPNGQMS